VYNQTLFNYYPTANYHHYPYEVEPEESELFWHKVGKKSNLDMTLFTSYKNSAKHYHPDKHIPTYLYGPGRRAMENVSHHYCIKKDAYNDAYKYTTDNLQSELQNIKDSLYHKYPLYSSRVEC